METDLRRRILDTARHLLVTEGYAALSMRKIARAIGYSATSIYLHFESKDALVHALIAEGMARLHDAMQAAATRHPEDPGTRLQALCHCYIAFGLANAEYYEIMFMLHPEQLARFPADEYRRARRSLAILASTLEAGAGEEVFTVADPYVAASAVWAALHGTVALLLAGRLDVRIEQAAFVEAAVGQVMRGYAGRDAPVER